MGTVCAQCDEDEAEARAAVHRAAWRPKRIGAMFVPPVDLGEAESSMTTESYRAVMEAWPYRHDLDQVVEAPDGTLAAFALGWLDEVDRAGELEPVGTDPRYAVRRAGIGGEPGLPARVARRWRDTGRRLSTWRRGVPRRPPSLLRARISAGRTNSDDSAPDFPSRVGVRLSTGTVRPWRAWLRAESSRRSAS